MDDNSENSIEKNIIKLSRNAPVALVVGVAGFLGSSITDRLLSKGIQVIGVDDFSAGAKVNLEIAVKDKNFHLLTSSAGKIDVSIDRLDYIYLASGSKWQMDDILKLFLTNKSKCILLSDISLYDKQKKKRLDWLTDTESELARFANKHNLNARIVRIGAVYGPRMNFKFNDPINDLIREALKGNLQKGVSLDFSTRALFIDDCVNLVIKSMMAGSTAQKIFDGVLPSPVKVAEVKQILLDPVWYEERAFNPSELPPWTTPNLEKTVKILDWHPQEKLITSLRKTIEYFKEHEITVPDQEVRESEKQNDHGQDTWKAEMKNELEAMKHQGDRKVKNKRIGQPLFYERVHKLTRFIYLGLISFLIFYALIWPAISLGWGVLTFRYQLSEAEKNLGMGEFNQSFFNIKQANLGIKRSEEIVKSFKVLGGFAFVDSWLESANKLINLAQFSAKGAEDTVLGVQYLYQGLKSVTGETNASSEEFFSNAQINLASADENFSKAFALSESEDFKKSTPVFFESRVRRLLEKLGTYKNLVEKGRAASILLPELIGFDKPKSYLILFQNNNELRPAGGFIGSFANITFEAGKLKNIQVNDIYAIDGQLNLKVKPPKEIQEDLGQEYWYLRDSNWESDFPTSARQAEWFFTKETGERVEGVIALDISAMEKLLEAIGPLNLSDYDEIITADNLFERAITHAETSFFAGTQAKRSFLTSLTNELLNKIFFLPNQNWPGIVTSLGASLEEKHMSIYLDDPKLFSYVVSQKWAAVLPRVAEKILGETQDILVPVEANLGANKSNYYLDRSYNLETTLGINGEISQRLRINYTNRSPSLTWPAGVYKNRMRVYLPFGTKLDRLLWGESDITNEAIPFVDYGRTGYSFLLTLQPKEQKNLILDYHLAEKLDFKDNRATYKLDIIKQMGTLADPFEWTITYPLNYKVLSEIKGEKMPQELTITTDLSKDRSFEVNFTK